MRGSFRGMFRFGCGAAYGAHGYSVVPPDQRNGISGMDNIDFRSYLHTLVSGTAAPRQKDDGPEWSTNINEIYPGVRVGESMDVAVIGIGFGIILSFCIGGCFLLGWIVDNNARAARLQYAAEYAAYERTISPAQYQPQKCYASVSGTTAGAQPHPVFGQPSSEYLNGTLRNDQVYILWH